MDKETIHDFIISIILTALIMLAVWVPKLIEWKIILQGR